MPIEFSHLVIADIGQAIELGNSTPEFQTGTDAPSFYSEATLRSWIVSDNGVTIAARDGQTLAGFLLGQALAPSRDAYINCTVVHPGYRNRGIATQLTESALKRFGMLGCNHVFSVVSSSNTAMLQLKQRLGFQASTELYHYVEKMI